jgi:hypothetical protein
MRDDRIRMVIGPAVGRGGAINSLCRDFPHYDLYLLASDDAVFVLDGWDQIVEAAMPEDGIGVINVARETTEDFVNWPCVSRKWIEALGWMHPPRMDHYCQDTAMQALSDALGRTIYMPTNALRHEAVSDETNGIKQRRDYENFLWFMAKDFAPSLAKLRAAM